MRERERERETIAIDMITIQVEKLSIIQSDFISEHPRVLAHSFVRSLERLHAQYFEGIELN